MTKPLRTTGGQKLEVIYPGRRCCDRGPDFRGAIIAFDGELRRGDVEVHVRGADWQAHRHHVDPAYDGVILHVVMWQTSDLLPRKSDGEVVPVLCVEPHLPVAVDDLPSLLVATPYTPFRCCEKGDPDRLLVSLDLAGWQRLLDKAASIEGDLAVLGPEEVLYRRIMVALGYARNTAPFAQLAEIVPFWLLQSIASNEKIEDRPLALRAFLLGKAGLLPSQRNGQSASDFGVSKKEAAVHSVAASAARRSPFYEMRVQAKWEGLAAWDDGCRVTVPWRFGGVRPDNFPTRRLIGAGELFSSFVDEGLCEPLLRSLRYGESKTAFRHLDKMVTVSRFIGRARAGEIVVNAVLPFAVAYGRVSSDEQLARRAVAAFRSYPLSAGNEISRYMSELILDTQSSTSLRTASRQQGLLHLYKTWCADKRCGDCPLGRSEAS